MLPSSISQAFTQVCDDLQETGASPEKLALTCAALTALAARPDAPELPLQESFPVLAQLLDHSSPLVQGNACAAVTAVCEANDAAWRAACQSDLACKATALLSKPADGSSDDNLTLNLLTMLGALADPGNPGLTAVMDAGGVEACQRHALGQQQPQLQEAALDSICRMSTAESARQHLSAKDMVGTLGTVIGQEQANMEAKVRALMALAMLLGGSPGNQERLAGMPQAVQGLTSLMQQTDDNDARHVSATIFSELAKSPGTKRLLKNSLQEPSARQPGSSLPEPSAPAA